MKGLIDATAALLTRQCTGPHDSTAFLVASQSAKSATTVRTSGNSDFSFSKFSGLLPKTYTIASRSLSPLTIAFPRPTIKLDFFYSESNLFK